MIDGAQESQERYRIAAMYHLLFLSHTRIYKEEADDQDQLVPGNDRRQAPLVSRRVCQEFYRTLLPRHINIRVVVLRSVTQKTVLPVNFPVCMRSDVIYFICHKERMNERPACSIGWAIIIAQKVPETRPT